MTREEAISHIEYSIKAYQNLIENDARSGEAIGKDIKGEWKSEKTLADAYMKMIESLKMAIKALDQEPRKGYWLHRPHVYGVAYCSVCDFELKIDNTNYCPNCGAKMESEANNG